MNPHDLKSICVCMPNTLSFWEDPYQSNFNISGRNMKRELNTRVVKRIAVRVSLLDLYLVEFSSSMGILVILPLKVNQRYIATFWIFGLLTCPIRLGAPWPHNNIRFWKETLSNIFCCQLSSYVSLSTQVIVPLVISLFTRAHDCWQITSNKNRVNIRIIDHWINLFK